MCCPTLDELPPPPRGKTGWPWTEESPQLPETMPDSSPWPRISVVTPSYNQGAFIEETIRSVLLQGYPNWEHIVIDGGSTDNTIEILKKYPHLKWISEKDRGQSHALNKGFRMAKGEIVGWLNSDDTYLSGAFDVVALTLEKSKGRYIVFGDCYDIDKSSKMIAYRKGRYSNNRNDLIRWWEGKKWIGQPALFFAKSLLEEFGELDEALHYGMDYDFWLRLSQKYQFCYISHPLATFRRYPGTKTTQRDRTIQERTAVSRRYWGSRRTLIYYKHLLSFVRHRPQIYWNLAVYHLSRNRWKSLKYSLYPILMFPPNLLRRIYLSLLLRAIWGNEFSDRLKSWLRFSKK